MAKPKFDPNAAFKNIVGVTEEKESNQETPKPSEAQPLTNEEQRPIGIIITGDKGKEETRSKRVNFIIKPSVYNMAKKKCEELNISLNECVNQFLEAWCKQ